MVRTAVDARSVQRWWLDMEGRAKACADRWLFVQHVSDSRSQLSTFVCQLCWYDTCYTVCLLPCELRDLWLSEEVGRVELSTSCWFSSMLFRTDVCMVACTYRCSSLHFSACLRLLLTFVVSIYIEV